MQNMNRRSEKGIALVLSILALLLLTAIAAGMMYMSTTERQVNNNFRQEEKSYFAARAGVEEVRDRMLFTTPNTICPNATPGVAPCLLPSTLPTPAGGTLYVLQTGVTMANDVKNFASPNADDEFCHDFAFGGMTAQPANVRCTNLPNSANWANSIASVAPFPLDYKWVRVTLKANNSNAYPVDGNAANGAIVCWDGVSEKPLPGGTANCGAMIPVANPVYLVTALAVSPNGSRRLVQQELAQTPIASQPGGLFATGVGCPALTLAGNAITHSFNSATEGVPTNPPSNVVNINGDIGANGGVAVNGSSAAVNGSVSSTLPASVGACPASAVSVSGHPSIAAQVQLPSPFSPPTPPAPNPLPPTTAQNLGNTTITPGSYGNVSITSHDTLTLTGGTVANPAVYTFNSISEAGQGTIAVTGPVVINIAGVGQATVLSLTGGGFANSSNVPSYMTFNYGGTGTINMQGGSGAYFALNAPQSTLNLQGNSAFYGQALAGTINVAGTPDFYWDTAANTPPPNATSFYEISLRELSY
jgi:hypothetical protein